MLEEKISTWLSDNFFLLEYGHKLKEYSVPGVPFKVHINKIPSDKPCLRIGRFLPGEDKDFPKRLNKQILEKALKLKSYMDKGYETIILLENVELVLQDIPSLFSLFNKELSVEIVNAVKYIWVLDTSIESEFEFHKVWG